MDAPSKNVSDNTNAPVSDQQVEGSKFNILDLLKSEMPSTPAKAASDSTTPQTNHAANAMLAGFSLSDASGDYNSGQYDPGNQYDAQTGTYTSPGYH